MDSKQRWGRILGGATLIGAGVLGMAVPVVPGFLIVAAGLGVLSPEVPAAQRLMERIRPQSKR